MKSKKIEQKLTVKVLTDLSEDNCLMAVKQKAENLAFIPEPSDGVIRAAIKKGGLHSLQNVNSRFFTKEHYEYAYSLNPNCLQYIPEEFRNDEMYLTSLKFNGSNLAHIKVKTPELCLAAMQSNPSSFPYIPEEFRTSEIYGLAVKYQNIKLSDVPKDKINIDVCLNAIHPCVGDFEQIPAEFITPEFCLKAVELNSNTLKYVPTNLLTVEMCMISVSKNASSFRYVPKEFQTDEICFKFLKSNYIDDYDCYKNILTDSEAVRKRKSELEAELNSKMKERSSKMKHQALFHSTWAGFNIKIDDFDEVDALKTKVGELTSEIVEMKKLQLQLIETLNNKKPF